MRFWGFQRKHFLKVVSFFSASTSQTTRFRALKIPPTTVIFVDSFWGAEVRYRQSLWYQTFLFLQRGRLGTKKISCWKTRQILSCTMCPWAGAVVLGLPWRCDRPRLPRGKSWAARSDLLHVLVGTVPSAMIVQEFSQCWVTRGFTVQERLLSSRRCRWRTSFFRSAAWLCCQSEVMWWPPNACLVWLYENSLFARRSVCLKYAHSLWAELSWEWHVVSKLFSRSTHSSLISLSVSLWFDTFSFMPLSFS